MDIFGKKFRRLCLELEQKGYVGLDFPFAFVDKEFMNKEGDIKFVTRGLFPRIR